MPGRAHACCLGLCRESRWQRPSSATGPAWGGRGSRRWPRSRPGCPWLAGCSVRGINISGPCCRERRGSCWRSVHMNNFLGGEQSAGPGPVGIRQHAPESVGRASPQPWGGWGGVLKRAVAHSQPLPPITVLQPHRVSAVCPQPQVLLPPEISRAGPGTSCSHMHVVLPERETHPIHMSMHRGVAVHGPCVCTQPL